MNKARALAQLSECLKGHVPADADWMAILTLASHNWITAEVYVALEDAAELPDDVRTFLEEVHRRNVDRNAHLFNVLRDSAAALNASGIEPVLLKGCATWVVGSAVQAPPTGRRILGDLDLLAPPADFDRAIDSLRTAGFDLIEDNRRQEHHPIAVLLRAGDLATIDLHKFPPGPRGVPQLDELAAHSRLVDCGGFRAKSPPGELQILIGILHDQFLDGHFWRGGFELRRLLDIAMLTKRAEVDWPRLKAICERAGILHAMSAELIAAKRIAGAEVPSEMICRGWGNVHYWRQRIQFVHPIINRPFHIAGLTREVWRPLSSRKLEAQSSP